jgi:hypothetical protein
MCATQTKRTAANDANELKTYPFKLRPDVWAFLKVPRLSVRDVDRIAAYLRTLAVDYEDEVRP